MPLTRPGAGYIYANVRYGEISESKLKEEK